MDLLEFSTMCLCVSVCVCRGGGVCVCQGQGRITLGKSIHRLFKLVKKTTVVLSGYFFGLQSHCCLCVCGLGLESDFINTFTKIKRVEKKTKRKKITVHIIGETSLLMYFI